MRDLLAAFVCWWRYHHSPYTLRRGASGQTIFATCTRCGWFWTVRYPWDPWDRWDV